MNCAMPLCTRSRIAITATLGGLITTLVLIAPAQAFAAPTPPTASRCGADATNTAASPKFPSRSHYYDCECDCYDHRRDCDCDCSRDNGGGW
jgi:hypothetical protein